MRWRCAAMMMRRVCSLCALYTIYDKHLQSKMRSESPKTGLGRIRAQSAARQALDPF